MLLFATATSPPQGVQKGKAMTGIPIEQAVQQASQGDHEAVMRAIMAIQDEIDQIAIRKNAWLSPRLTILNRLINRLKTETNKLLA